MKLFNDIYKGKKVWVSGGSGFKGTWLLTWLDKMGAIVKNYSLEPNEKLPLPVDVINEYNDIRNIEALRESIKSFNPEIILHLAAQPIVDKSYSCPSYTYDVNAMGVVNLLEVCREVDSIKAIINVTTDKVYSDRSQLWGYRESDPMGGYDPYSSSKACSEIITESYRNSFFNKKGVLVATARSGNVLGGGDWGEQRIIPNIVNAALTNTDFIIRDATAVRPWQYVLSTLAGYLLLGQKLLEGKKEFCDAWNFGPIIDDATSVKDIFTLCSKYWNKVNNYKVEGMSFHETIILRLDSAKSRTLLKWKPAYNIEDTIEKTILWYKAYYEDRKIITLEQIDEYEQKALEKNLVWIQE